MFFFRCLFQFLLVWAMGCTAVPQKPQIAELSIMEVKPDRATALVTQNLMQLNQVYNLAPFLFTRLIRVQSNVPSRPAPVLIVNTRFGSQPHLLLTVLLHQQMLRWLLMNRGPTRRALTDVRKIYTKLPQAETGELRLSPHLRLLASYLEYRALQMYLGGPEAKLVLERLIQSGYFPELYSLVIKDGDVLEQILKARELFPRPLAKNP